MDWCSTTCSCSAFFQFLHLKEIIAGPMENDKNTINLIVFFFIRVLLSDLVVRVPTLRVSA